jgi:hypothetical protein
MARLRGAVALVLHKHFGPSERSEQDGIAIEPMQKAG